MVYELDSADGLSCHAVLSRPRGWESPQEICCARRWPGPVTWWDAEGQPVGVPRSTRAYTPIVQVTATTDDQNRQYMGSVAGDARRGPRRGRLALILIHSVALRRGREANVVGDVRQGQGRRRSWTETYAGNGGPKLAKTLRSNVDKPGGPRLRLQTLTRSVSVRSRRQTARFYELMKAGLRRRPLRGLYYDHRQAPSTPISRSRVPH